MKAERKIWLKLGLNAHLSSDQLFHKTQNERYYEQSQRDLLHWTVSHVASASWGSDTDFKMSSGYKRSTMTNQSEKLVACPILVLLHQTDLSYLVSSPR